MPQLETPRLILRPFSPDDWRDLQEVAIDWAAAPGPAFDKWPTGDEDCRGFASYLAAEPRYHAMALREGGKVVGLLALNGIEADGRMDLGHVVHSSYQENDLDREALRAMVDLVFRNRDVLSIVTRNAPEHAEQLAPLRSLGFRVLEQDKPGELTLARSEWEQDRGAAFAGP